MPDQTSVDRLRQGVKTWNQWRWQHPEMRPDLSYANLSGTDLSGADLSRAHLSYAILSSASLSGADLSETLLLHSLSGKTWKFALLALPVTEEEAVSILTLPHFCGGRKA